MSKSDTLLAEPNDILIPEGEYTGFYTHHESCWVFQKPKVFIYFQITDPGQHYGKSLYMSGNAKYVPKSKKKNGRVKLRKRQKIFEVLCRLFDGPDFRPDRLSLKMLENKIIRFTVRTVTTDYKQDKLSPCLHYSVIDDLITIEVGNAIT